MRIAIAVLASGANASQDGNLNIFGIFDQVTAKAFPAVHGAATLVIGMRFSRAEVGQHTKVEIKLMDDDNVLVTLAGEFVVPERPDRSSGDVGINQILNISPLAVPHAGRYAFHVVVNGREEAEIPFTAVLGPPGTSV